MVLISPSYGMGNWDMRHGPEAVMNALDDTAKHLKLDLSRVHLAGLSNGGLGVSRTAASRFGNRFRSLLLVSPMFDTEALKSASFEHYWHGKPVLVITGEEDDRVPRDYVEDCAALMRNSDTNVEMTTYPGANHFLFFSHRDRFLKQFSEWLARQDG